MGEDYEFSGQRILELLGKAGKLLHESHIYEGVEEVGTRCSILFSHVKSVLSVILQVSFPEICTSYFAGEQVDE